MSRIVTVPVSLFLQCVKQIADEKPRYKLGHDGSDGLCDCIGLIRGALNRAGANPTNMRGTNEAARKSIRNLHRIKKVADLQLGQVVLKVRDMDDPDYPLPSKYRVGGKSYNGDLTNYTHIGVVSQIGPLRITHMTSPTAQHDTRLGKWIYAGDLPWVSSDESGGERMKATVTSENGGPVRVRTCPGGDTITKLPVGTQVEVITSGPEWSVIRYPGGSGYIMTSFLGAEGAPDPDGSGTVDLITVQLPDSTIQLTMSTDQATALRDALVAKVGRG